MKPSSLSLRSTYCERVLTLAVRFHLNSSAPADDDASDFDTPSPADKPTKRKKSSSSKSSSGQHNGQSTFAVLPPTAPAFNAPVAAPMGRSAVPSIAYLTSQAPYMPNSTNLQDYTQSVPPPRILDFAKPPALALDDEYRSFPLQDVQEACLLRYFIDEISQWVSCPVSRSAVFIACQDVLTRDAV